MITTILNKVFGTAHEREMKRLQPLIDLINGFESKIQTLTDAQLQHKTVEFRERLEKGEHLDAILPEAFAVCREASKRVLGMRHYDVQLIGGMVLHRGAIAEMRTGEGKTLVGTLACYLNGLTRKGVHVVTVNEYLAARDAEWMGRLYRWLGLTVGVIRHELSDQERQAAYACDITYATNSELGFDYLRDNMKFRLEDYVQKELNFAIVDECDSILIDEARTPLIISGPAEDSVEKYYTINSIIPQLKRDVHFSMEEKSKSVSMTDEGNDKIEKLLGIENLYDPRNIDVLHHIYQGLKAHHLYLRDREYMVVNGEVMIVDEFTGRLMEGRRWSDGLHQAVEAKEGVKVKNENQTLATITYQNFFRMYKKMAGMTGTAETEAVEMKKIYNLEVVCIPTNRPIQRQDHDDVVYKTELAKFQAIVDEIKTAQERGQPVLVGTVSIEKSELLSTFLKKAGITHSVLNAKQHEREAEFVAQAGRYKNVTIATNMAGRGTDIVLGGNPEYLARQVNADIDTQEYKDAYAKFKGPCDAEKAKVIEAGGLYIIGTERHEARRIDNQLRGRAGRQGDPGQSRFFLSLDDDLMRIFNGERLQKIFNTLNVPDNEPITHRMVTSSIEGAQRRREGSNFDIRKHLLEYDDVMNKQRLVIYGMRREVLQGGDVADLIREMLGDVTHAMLENFVPEKSKPQDWDLDGLKTAVQQQFGVGIELATADELTTEQINSAVGDAIKMKWDAQNKHLGTFFNQIQRHYLLESIDQHWKEHLQRLDQVREWIGLKAYAQRDPLVEYKQEAFKAFEEMKNLINADVIEKLFKVQLMSQAPSEEGLGAGNTMSAGAVSATSSSSGNMEMGSRAPVNGASGSKPNGSASKVELPEELEEVFEKPKQKHRLTFSSGGSDSSEAGGPKMSRADRRKLDRDKKKNKSF